MKKNILVIFALFTLILFQSCQKDEDIPTQTLSEEEEYLLDIALGSEFGSSSSTVKKWATDMKIFLKNPSHTVLVEEFEKVIDEINQLSSSIILERVDDEADANFVIFFSDKDSYAAYEPAVSDLVEDNWGLVWIYWNSRSEIYKGSMYVDIFRTQETDCQKHLLREELTQSLGLLKDSYNYPESIFYQDWNCTTYYSDIDRILIQLFLNPQIEPGMSRDEVIAILEEI